MRPGLLHTLSGSRDRRRHRGPHATTTHSPATPSPAASVAVSHPADLAAQRVREAGGPIDRAAYTCECGYVFSAPVSTTVHCPHCGAGQAW
jgi:hypothetical protein